MNCSFNSWQRLNNVPYYFFFYYVPYRLSKIEAFGSFSITCQRFVWNFKDGYKQESFFSAFEKLINYSFKGDLTDLTLVCIPASTRKANICRYQNFSETVCQHLHLNNAFDHIEIVKEKEPKHISGISSPAEYRFDTQFFKGKKVLLFDDIVTKGSSMMDFTHKLQALGADVIACVSLGLTYWEPNLGHDPVHPYRRYRLREDIVVPPAEDEFSYFTVQHQTAISENSAAQSMVVEKQHVSAPAAILTSVSAHKKLETQNKVQAGGHSEPVYLDLLQIAEKSSGTGQSRDNHLQYCAGKIIRFGKFNGRALEWRILVNNGSEVILITKYGIHNRPYNDVLENTTWEECSLRTWLNDDFLHGAFTVNEQNKICVQKVKAEVVNGHELNPGHDTNDKVSILSIEEYCKLFKDNWKCVLQSTGKLRQCWLRNYGVDRMHGAFIGRSGSLHEGGSLVNSPRNAVRPVIVMKIKDLL